MDPLVKNTMWADASVRKGVEVALEIMRLKFNVQAQDITKLDITHVKQPVAVQWCVTMQKKLSGVIFFGCFTLHTSETYSEPSQISEMKLFVNVINGFQQKAPSQMFD